MKDVSIKLEGVELDGKTKSITAEAVEIQCDDDFVNEVSALVGLVLGVDLEPLDDE